MSQQQFESIAQIMAEAEKAYAAVRTFLPPAAVWQAMDQAARAAQVFAEWKREQQRLKPFVENGICVAPSMPQEMIEECQRRYAARKGIVNYVLAEYRRNRWQLLRSAVASWDQNRHFRDRIHIIEEALWAHQRGRYAATIALLMFQVEGIVLNWAFADDAMQAVQKMEAKRRSDRNRLRKNDNDELTAYTAHLVTAVIGKLTVNTLTTSEWLCMRSLVRFCDQQLYHPYRLFQDHVKLLNSDQLYRHAFAHGSTLEVGTVANSLRLFLALDVLSLVQ